MEAGSVVRAVFEFLPSVSEELPLFTGDVIEVLSVVDEFWLLGIKDGVTGQFPSTFVELVTIPSTKAGENLYVCINDFSSVEGGNLALKRGDVVAAESCVDSVWMRGHNAWGSRGLFPVSCVKELELSGESRLLSERSAAVQASELPPHALGQAHALMSLHAQLDEELDFREGDLITIVGLPEPGWFQGELDGRTGVFPEGFVELLGPLRSPLEEPDCQTLKQYSAYSMEQMERMEEEERDEVNSEVELQECQKVEEEEEEEGAMYGIALYEFRALEPGELDFDVGDRIRILATLEDGWLEGQIHGRRGIFPHRFVKMEGQLQTVPQTEVLSNEMNVPLREECYTPDHILTQDNHAVPEFGQEWVEQEDYTVWDLDYFERREEERKINYVDQIPSSKSSQEKGITPNQSQSQERRRDRPPPPHTQYHRAGISAHRGVLENRSGSPNHGRPQLPPRPSQHALNNRKYRTSSSVNLREPPVAPILRNQSVNALSKTSLISTWTRNNGRYASHNNRTNFSNKLSTENRQKKLIRYSSISDADLRSSGHKHQRHGSNGFPSSQTLGNLTPSPGDLEAKLSQQLLEFDRSLPGHNNGSTEQSRWEEVSRGWGNKVSRHFSIMDYCNEHDIIHGSTHSTERLLSGTSSPCSSLERRKNLRPPPPRPHFIRPTDPTSTNNALTNSRTAPQPYKPTRPAPRPPPPCPLNNAMTPQSTPNLVHISPDEEEIIKDAQEAQNEMEGDKEGLLLRLEEVDRELEMYSHTVQELQAMLDEEQDEISKQQVLENLEFCSYTMETLTLEQQQLQATNMKGQVIIGHPMPFEPVSWDLSRAPPKRGKSVEELTSEGWEKERCIQMLHFQQQQQLQQTQLIWQQDFRAAPRQWQQQAYVQAYGHANGYRQQCWEYEDWDKVYFRDSTPPQQFFYQSPEAVYQDPRKPQEWTANHCFYQHQEPLDYSDHRDFAHNPRNMDRPDRVTRYDSLESDGRFESQEPYRRRDRNGYNFDHENSDYYDKEREEYIHGEHKGWDRYDLKELDKFDYDYRDMHNDRKHQEQCEYKKKDRYRNRGSDRCASGKNYRYEQFDHSNKDHRDYRKEERYGHCEEDRKRGDHYHCRERDSLERKEYDRFVHKKGDYYDYKIKDVIRDDLRKEDCEYKSERGEKDYHKREDEDRFEHRKRNRYDLKSRDRYDYKDKYQPDQRDCFELDCREKDNRSSWKDERYDSGVKDCNEDKGCESDHYEQKSRERYRDLRSNSLEQKKEGFSVDHGFERNCKKWEKDVYRKKTQKEIQPYEDPVYKDRYMDLPRSEKLDAEGQGRRNKPCYVGSLDRNSFYRKTAPSSLRKSDFATNRKKKQVTPQANGECKMWLSQWDIRLASVISDTEQVVTSVQGSTLPRFYVAQSSVNSVQADL
ncbi:hypothetical protein DNTS_017984 [Danionella cerebrum]|uniref:SH3 domain-containing protein n=1 Tax=Danionella cerebrum TaxID=2873325 RepID=A0A553RDG9_9TELE|nr:hypothetical protein DNTS_017984 [Danionella translucida]